MAKSVRQSIEIRDALYERIAYDCEKVLDGGTNVFFYLMPPPGHVIEHASRWKLLHVAPDMLTIYPFTESIAGYQSKYEALDRVLVTAKRSHPYEEPADEHDVQLILGELPEGLERNPLNGLGFTTQNRFIPNTIAGLAHRIRIVIEGGNKQPYYDAGFYVISQSYLKQLGRGMEAIASRYRRQAMTDKRNFAYNELLSTIDPEAFPIKQKKVNAAAMFELVKVGKVSASLPKTAQRNVVDLVIDNAQSIVKNAPEALYALAAKIETVTLQEMIIKFEDMLGKDLNETKWQKFFEANTFILSMAFAVPTVFVKETPYVHGKRITGQGGKFSDFLMRGQGTGNLALIEIKAPGTAILSTYRNEQPGASNDLTGAITQVLGHRRRITTGWYSLKVEDDGTLKDTELYSPQAIVLIGTMPTLKSDREAFEAFRNILKDIAVITFDELLMRLQYLHQALTVQPPALSAPPGMPMGTQPPLDNELAAKEDDEIPF